MSEMPDWFDSLTHALYGWWAGPLVDLCFYAKKITKRIVRHYFSN